MTTRSVRETPREPRAGWERRERRQLSRPREGGPGVHLWDATVLSRIGIGAAVILSIFPLYWMVMIATRTDSDVSRRPPPVWFGGELGSNVGRLISDDQSNFGTGLMNSFIISGTVTFSTILLATMAGFAFAKLRFRGRNGLMLLVLFTMMVPLQQIGVVPLYLLMVDLGWTNQLRAVILPFLVSGFGVFLMRQYTLQAVPDELVEAARVDGASTIRIYWNIVLPALRPGIAVLGLLTFMQSWNEFLWPLVVLRRDNPTVQLSISFLRTQFSAEYALVFTGTAISILPLVIVFILFGRQILGGIMEGALRQ